MIIALPTAVALVNDALDGIVKALSVPVHLAAVVLLLALCVELGRAATEVVRRVRPGRPGLAALTRTVIHQPTADPNAGRQAPTPIAGQAVEAIAAAVSVGRPQDIEPALAAYELAVQRRLDRTRLLVRAGPAVGLMGTLIPLAPGLAALSDGDIATLATNLQTAFAATVIGLLVGTVAFALTLIRSRVFTEDLAGLERAVAELVGVAAPPDQQASGPPTLTTASGVRHPTVPVHGSPESMAPNPAVTPAVATPVAPPTVTR